MSVGVAEEPALKHLVRAGGDARHHVGRLERRLLDLGEVVVRVAVEDHPTNRRVVQLILEAIDVDLTCVEDGAQAVEAAARQDFDLILMDMQMPVMDGLTAIRAIREREAGAGAQPTRIISLTANAMPEHAEASRQAGANGHLTKPIAADKLIAAVLATDDDAGDGGETEAEAISA